MRSSSSMSPEAQVPSPGRASSRSVGTITGLAWLALAVVGVLAWWSGQTPGGEVPYWPVCLWQWWTNWPCPLCGLTRSLVWVAQGQWALACQYHLLAIPLYGGLWWVALAGVFRPVWLRRSLAWLQRPPMLWLGLAMLGAAWVAKLMRLIPGE